MLYFYLLVAHTFLNIFVVHFIPPVYCTLKWKLIWHQLFSQVAMSPWQLIVVSLILSYFDSLWLLIIVPWLLNSGAILVPVTRNIFIESWQRSNTCSSLFITKTVLSQQITNCKERKANLYLNRRVSHSNTDSLDFGSLENYKTLFRFKSTGEIK